jgi:hypothetical protein
MKRLIGLCALAALCGCSTITRGTNDTWVVETTPPGAEVSTSNGYQCASTPCAIKMPRRSEFVATIEKDGYETVTVNVTYQVSGSGGAAMAGNVLVGGIIGAAVDAGTGSMNDLVPNPVAIDLVPVASPDQPVAEPAAELAADAPGTG